jgi:hypothetical protein
MVVRMARELNASLEASEKDRAAAPVDEEDEDEDDDVESRAQLSRLSSASSCSRARHSTRSCFICTLSSSGLTEEAEDMSEKIDMDGECSLAASGRCCRGTVRLWALENMVCSLLAAFHRPKYLCLRVQLFVCVGWGIGGEGG